MRKGWAVAVLLLAAACTTPEERAAEQAAEQVADRAECQAIGFKPQTEPFANCVLRMKEIRAEQENARAQRLRALPPPWYYSPFYPHHHYPYYY